ncbi:hypothetical protein WJX73_007101 [Symbiochloris irregularis]|uniref:Uncharacterized protein n=1 Tax=Symbiochloris irregularis TaxID=706552 RepID=A0AAW1PE84_9CHLO
MAYEEEERLREQREKESKRRALADAFAGPSLEDGKFKRLDELLQQSEMYTTFLVENIKEYEQQRARDSEEAQPQEDDAEEEEQDDKADKGPRKGGKRKAAAKGGRGAKRSKTSTEGRKRDFSDLIQGKLRNYQVRGINWLIALYNNGVNGILADQMGLGKTVQTIGLLAHMRTMKVYGPFIIIAPLSTLTNWVAEFKRWCPEIPTVLYHGSKAERASLRRTKIPVLSNQSYPDTFPVVVTSYEIVLADAKALQSFHWKYVVVDEGHRLKNYNSKLLRELRQMQSANRLLLTGTPLQNNLSELWSLMNFLLPDIFSNLESFQSWFDFSQVGEASGQEAIIAQQQQSQVVSKLHGLLKPFLLRRLKSDVEDSLPPKAELLLWAPMSKVQHQINSHLAENTLHEAMEEMAKKQGGGKATVKLNNVLMQMRKNCNHPDLITSATDGSVQYPDADELARQCGKLQLLDRLLVQLHKGGHKVLIFSQMTKLLDLLDTFLEQRGHQACRIDGSVSWQDRQKAMSTFNTDKDVFVFLLSTRAGGLGINLTSADTVIIYDSDWNPHQDMQAMDRAHRIGQTRPVLVLRLATARSVEGRLLKRANSKLALERVVIKKGHFLDPNAERDGKATNMDSKELLELLRQDHGTKDEPQSGVLSDKMLATVLDRRHMEKGKPAPYPDSGVGYECIDHSGSSGVLSAVH